MRLRYIEVYSDMDMFLRVTERKSDFNDFVLFLNMKYYINYK